MRKVLVRPLPSKTWFTEHEIMNSDGKVAQEWLDRVTMGQRRPVQIKTWRDFNHDTWLEVR
jgi:hypothetical protein